MTTRTTEGLPNECSVCGKEFYLSPSTPPGDVTCPHCGSATWLTDPPLEVPDTVRLLEELGAAVEVNDEGQVRCIRLDGLKYDDGIILQLSRITGVETLDISRTAISPQGAIRLKKLMPETTIISRRP